MTRTELPSGAPVRARTGALFVLSIFAGAALTWWAVDPLGPGAGPSVVQYEHEHTDLEGGTLTGRARLRSAAAPGFSGATGARTIPCRVLARSTGRLLTGARVRLMVDSEAHRMSGTFLPADVKAESATDEAGVCELRVPDDWTSGILFVTAPGFAAVQRNVAAAATQGDVQEVRLGPGERIRGRVVDRNGEPIAGVEVLASHWTLPRGGRVHGALGGAGREVARTSTDGRGGFLVDVGPGRYRISAAKDGWVPSQSRPGGRLFHKAIVVEAGAPDVEITLRSVRVFCVRLLNPEGQPIATYASRFSLLHDRLARRGLAEWPIVFEGTRWIDLRELDLGVGVYVRAVYPADDRAPPETVGLAVQVWGYRGVVVQAPLRLPSALRAPTPVDDLVVPREGDARIGTVRVTSRRSLPEGLPPATDATLRVEMDDGVVAAYRGVAGPEDSWEFRGVPAGRRRMFFDDGISLSYWLTADVAPAGTVEVEASFPPISGLEIVARTAVGQRILDCAIIAERQGEPRTGRLVIPGGNTRTITHPNSPEVLDRMRARGGGNLVAPDGSVARLLYRCAPGPYKIYVARPGFGAVSRELEIAEGKITRLEVQLEPEAR